MTAIRERSTAVARRAARTSRALTRRLARRVTETLRSPRVEEPQHGEHAGSPAAPPAVAPLVTRTPETRLEEQTVEADETFAECPICDTVVESFLPAGEKRVHPDRRCPTCGSFPRHRAAWLFFTRKTNLFTDELKMLHLAPEPCLRPRLAHLPNLAHVTADLAAREPRIRTDFTAMGLRDGSFDVVYASHVFEHIPDDVQAMREVHRVLRPGGWAVLQVPIFHPKTREDPTVVDPQERERLFGQSDHVRMYGHDGVYAERLRSAGFDVRVDPFVSVMPPAESRRFRLQEDEDIYYCTKAGS